MDLTAAVLSEEYRSAVRASHNWENYLITVLSLLELMKMTIVESF